MANLPASEPGSIDAGLPPMKALSPRLRRYLNFVDSRRRLAANGGLRLAPDGVWLSVTENCNFRCVGCYTEGLFKKTYVSIDDVRNMLSENDARFTYISLTEGEAFLHPELCEIIELCKAMHPEALIDLVTNASIPVRGKCRTAVSLIDSLGVSIDGAIKETYEKIRKGGNFERFLANARDIAAVRIECGRPKLLEFSFTAMTENIADCLASCGLPLSSEFRTFIFSPWKCGKRRSSTGWARSISAGCRSKRSIE